MSDVMILGDTPSEAETDAWHAVVTACHLHDMPPTVPPPSRAETAGQLLVPAVLSHYVKVVVPAPEGGYVGVGQVRLFEDEGNRSTAWIGDFAVRPEHRRRGIGTRMWHVLRAAIAAEGRTSATTEVEIGGAGEQFARAHGFDSALSMIWYVQRVADETTGPSLPDGYRFVEWTGVVPAEHAPGMAHVHNAMHDSPNGDLEMRPLRWDAERVTRAQSAAVERGGTVLTVAAIAPDGGYAAYTEVVLRSPDDVRAIQYATAVAPAHRGHGLGLAVKRRMLGLIRDEGLPVREIATTVADDNGPMRAVNKLLGYRPERSMGLFQVRLPSG
ncbi:GNAT family N-acetyltransferase [Streptomyces sp. UNOC14_S4]|uniref:GNAT family N-acetyltransferase n=1 Tax=Streptomyces sp. UNOC14_S4 TaxID=2872340 RepID=UPI001E30CA38|nr:GNAT family N-acetyltransferase [Streptomyces sp. UNOC14_S4]MCC3772121.1 GNAT family N-acetyltransferase [Streptomyces sp. UNOC14_S4]